ncbi:MAG: putative transcriptional regulator [Rhodobacteraceae bacterium HLUCCO07]|nr:MAG: putative transcriptional regulator [Rhodobacteraceae bacterium HLUCCO07]
MAGRMPGADDLDMDLTGTLLIAMPGMGDPRFDKSVVFVCAHSDEGAMGLIVNKPTDDLRLSALVEQLELGDGGCARDLPVYFGGPVEHGRGFVLHSGDYTSPISTLRVNDDFALTATLDILEELAAGRGPMRAIMALGYAGWGPGQLESEILANGWLTAEAGADLVFDTADARKWSAALRTLGVDPLSLSAAAGRA